MPRAKRLATVGAQLSDDNAEVVLVDAADAFKARELADGALVESTFDDLPEQLSTKLEQGATVVLHGLTPQNIARWRRILPPGVKLNKVDSRRGLRSAQHPLLPGMCGTDLWWGHMRAWGEEGPVAVAYALEGVDAAAELVRPGAVSVFEVASGCLVIDQLLWDSDEVNQRRSGQYLALLLTNLTRSMPVKSGPPAT